MTIRKPIEPQPGPLSLSLPKYPEDARALDIAGEVEVVVTVENGMVLEAEALSGDVLLRRAAEANVHTWKFQCGFSGRTTTTFAYVLEDRALTTPGGTIVEFRGSTRITISATIDRW
ncbi:MAG: energy transducer TonB [Rhodococcus sp. (in: high G+C Gram-positive bacteria)]